MELAFLYRGSYGQRLCCVFGDFATLRSMQGISNSSPSDATLELNWKCLLGVGTQRQLLMVDVWRARERAMGMGKGGGSSGLVGLGWTIQASLLERLFTSP